MHLSFQCSEERERQAERWGSVLKQHSLFSEFKVSENKNKIINNTKNKVQYLKNEAKCCRLPPTCTYGHMQGHTHKHAYKVSIMVDTRVLWQGNGRPNLLHMLKCIRHLRSSDGINLFISTFILKYRKIWEASIPVHSKTWLCMHPLKCWIPRNIWKTKLPLLCE